MISISRQTDYACRVILHLAMLPEGERVTAQEIAGRRLIPRALVRRVITQLANAGLLVTTRGVNGGLALARLPSEISLLDVVEAMDGPLALNACVANPESCPLMRICSVHEAWVRAQASLATELRRETFDKLAMRGEAKVQITVPVQPQEEEAAMN